MQLNYKSPIDNSIYFLAHIRRVYYFQRVFSSIEVSHESNFKMKRQLLRMLFLVASVGLSLLILFFLRLITPSSLALPTQILESSIGAALILIVIAHIRKPITLKIGLVDMPMVFSILLLVLLNLFSQSSTVLNIDRSRSFYLLSWVQSDYLRLNNGILETSKLAPMEAKNSPAILFRINEQLDRGFITVEKSGSLSLTFSGRVLLGFSKLTATLFKLSGWTENTI